MGAANGRALAINKRLHTEADAIHTLALRLGEDCVDDLSWRGFEGDFGVGRNVECLSKRSKDAAKLFGFEQAGGATPEINRINSTRKLGVE